jgi:hypothetical protein
LTALEACQYPFQLPEVFGIEKEIPAPRSPYGNDTLGAFRALVVSRRRRNQRSPSSLGVSLITKPLPRVPSSVIPEEPERPITPLLQMAKAHIHPIHRGWGEQWRHLARQPTKRSLTRSDSAISGFSWSSADYPSSASESSRISKENKLAKVVTPSSSISNLKRRSPLSTVR